MRNALVVSFLALLMGCAHADTHRLKVGGGTVVLTIEPGKLDVSEAHVVNWVHEAAQAVSNYLGKFPVPEVTVNIKTDAYKGPHNGHTHCGVPPLIWVSLGMHTSVEDLRNDDVMTHELVHLMLPNADHGQQGWAAEGLATYVEALARLGVGKLDRIAFWEVVSKAIAKAGDGSAAQGLDATKDSIQRYWSGALFWLTADIEIRRRLPGRSLADALKGLNKAGGCISEHWPIEQSLAKADAALGQSILVPLARRMRSAAVGADVAGLLARLGVSRHGERITLDDSAPDAALRRAIESANLQFTSR